MKIQSINDPAFLKYGKVLTGYDLDGLIAAMDSFEIPDDVVYVASSPELERLPVFQELQNRGFGGVPIQVGYCNGHNKKLNALEYHRCSEINVACTDMVLLLGAQQDIDLANYTYDTQKLEAFLVPKGAAIEVYATTLHYAPCHVSGEGFRSVVVLSKDTNTDLDFVPQKKGEDALLFAKNKWLVAHPDSGLDEQGAWMGLKGDNITI